MIETARLRLRMVDERDAPAAVRLITPDVSRWLASWPTPLDETTAARRLRELREVAARGDGLCLAIEHRESGEMIGLVLIVRSRDEARRGGLGYLLGAPYHRQGYMLEAAQAALAEAFARLSLDVVEAGAQPDNTASLTIMRKLGMRAIGERTVWASARDREEVCAYYEITRTEYAGRHAG